MRIKVISTFSEQSLEKEIQTLFDSAECAQVHQTTFTTTTCERDVKYTAYIMYSPN